MRNLELIKETMSSLQIAEVTGKLHKNVLADIRNILEQGVAELNFQPSTYKDGNGQDRPCYELTQKGCLILASGYDALLREKIINRWEELEVKEKSTAISLPDFSNPAEAARAWAKEYEEKQTLLISNEEMKPKAEFYDAVVDSKTAIDMAQVAKTLNMGMGRNQLFEFLREKHVLMGNNSPMQYYVDNGWFRCVESHYTKPNGDTCINIKTVVFQKGMDGIRKLLNNK